MEKNVAKQNISDAIIITPYAQNKIPSKRFALNFVKKWVANSPTLLFTFADMAHRFWWEYVGILKKDGIIYQKLENYDLTHKSNDENL